MTWLEVDPTTSRSLSPIFYRYIPKPRMYICDMSSKGNQQMVRNLTKNLRNQNPRSTWDHDQTSR